MKIKFFKLVSQHFQRLLAFVGLFEPFFCEFSLTRASTGPLNLTIFSTLQVYQDIFRIPVN